MNENIEEGCERENRFQNTSEGMENNAIFVDTNDDTEDSVFTVWEHNEKDTSDYIHFCKDGLSSFEPTNQYAQYDTHDNASTTVQDLEMQDYTFQIPPTSSDLTAALQTEREFLNFMSSLPQVQNVNKESSDIEPEKENMPPSFVQTKSISKPAPLLANASDAGLNHLDNLCRMIEQLKELKEQNSRLQSRVHYLEDLKALEDMHNDMASRDSTFCQLALRDFNLSASELRLEEIPESPLFRRDSDESLDSFLSSKKIEIKDDLLELPPDAIHLRSSSDDDSRRTESTETPSTASKDKKMSKTTWGKVKNIMNYNKKDNLRKKPQSLDPSGLKHRRLPNSMATTSSKTSPKVYREPTGVYDTEEYDLYCEPYDGDGSSWDWEGEIEAGIWINPNRTDYQPEYSLDKAADTRQRRKKKPHLTITVPSCEDVSIHNVNAAEQLPNKEGIGKISPESTGSSKDRKHSPNYSTTPPSPRRTSHWSKVKQAFLTGHNQNISWRQTQKGKIKSYISPPNSPSKRAVESSFSFDGSDLKTGETDDGFSSELSPSLSIEKSRMEESSPTAVQGLQKNLMDLQKTLTGEFTKKLNEWEKLKKVAGQDILCGQKMPSEMMHGLPLEDNIPFEFRKKMYDWDKAKLKERDKGSHTSMPMNILHFNQSNQQHSVMQKDLKTKNYEEETLPPDFRKKLTEWHIRKALIGKCEHDVEEIQKNLGEDFNKKMTEWEIMKAQAKATVESEIAGVPLEACIQPLGQHRNELRGRLKNRASFPVGAKLTSLAGAAAIGATSFVMPSSLDRKGSGQKLKKLKSKEDKTSPGKGENVQKSRNKELQWLEKELNKIEREKQRLEREKEKFLERETRLEKMKYAMKERQPETKEIYIKTSTGEFRFEGISQTFTKKLYEWEVRRGIRPESSTFILLDPNYKAPGQALGDDKPRTPEPKRIVKSRSESSLTERAVASVHSNASTVSLNEEKEESHSLQVDSKAASEPTLPTEDIIVDRQPFTLLLQKEEACNIAVAQEGSSPEVIEEILEANLPQSPPYAPHEITRLIDSSESEERYRFADTKSIRSNGSMDNSYLKRSNSVKSEEDYRSLLHENMTLLGQLKEKENVCRAIETQMGDLDDKMDNVADQHIRTLERLHRQVNIMRKSESFGKPSTGENYFEETESERNRLLITQLKSRIAELEEKGDRLMEEKEELECAFTLHKEQESQIAESLLLRIRELQEAGAEVNIQTVQCQTDDLELNESHETSDGNKGSFDGHDLGVPVKKKRRRKRDESKSEQRCLIDDESEDEHIPPRRSNKDQKDVRRKKRPPPRNVQKLHNLTADLLFQAKRLEQGIIAKRNLCETGNKKVHRNDSLEKHIIRNRSLKTQRSLRLPIKDNEDRSSGCLAKLGSGASKTWSSIEAIGTEKISDQWKSRASAILFESQDLLKLNSDLTRMARELRKEMTNIWSFKDSTSESNSSDNKVGHLESVIERDVIKLEKEDSKLHEEEVWLAKQATEVFKSIASLQSENTLWPSSRELSLDEEPNKLNVKKESFCSTTDEFNDQSEVQLVEVFNFDQSYSRNQLEEWCTPHIDSTLNSKIYTEREGIFLDGNCCSSFRDEVLNLAEKKSNSESSLAGPININYVTDTMKSSSFGSQDQFPSSYPNNGHMQEELFHFERDNYMNDEVVEENSYSAYGYNEDEFCPRSRISKNMENLQKVVIQSQPFLNTEKMANGPLLDSSKGIHTPRKYRLSKILPFETEVNHIISKDRSPGKYLRTRRVSDSQIDYTSYKKSTIHRKSKHLYPNSSSSSKMQPKDAPIRRNRSENNVLLLASESTAVDGRNIFVPTKRTIFTVIGSEGCISHVKKAIIEVEGGVILGSSNIGISEQSLKDLPGKKCRHDISNYPDINATNMSNMHEISRNSVGTSLVNDNMDEKSLSSIQSQSNPKDLTFLLRHPIQNNSTPLCYKNFPMHNECSEVNNKHKGFQAVIDIFNNRITRNQQLLINPFSMGDPFIEVKKRQALSSDYIDILHSEENFVLPYPGLEGTRAKASERPALNFFLNGSKVVECEDLLSRYDNAKALTKDSLELYEGTVTSRKLKVNKAKEEFFQQMLNSGEHASCSDSGGHQLDGDCPEETKHDSEGRPYEIKTLSCNNDKMARLEVESISSSWTPPKPPRSSICGVDLRAENISQHKGDRNSLLSNLANSKLSKSIMRIFRKEKSPVLINKSPLEILCRQSLNVDIGESTALNRECMPSIQIPSNAQNRECMPPIQIPSTARQSEMSVSSDVAMTLPRSRYILKNSPSSHSCPATPILQQKSKTSKWMDRSRKMLKGKAPSNAKKIR